MEPDAFSQELVCAVCLDFFSDPVTLRCGHAFCRPCVTRCWAHQRTGCCPTCRQCSPAKDLRRSRVLRTLSEKARDLGRRARWADGTGQRADNPDQERGRTPSQCQESPLAPAVDSLRKARAARLESKQKQEENILKIKEQSHIIHTHITTEFAELRQILAEREERLIRDLSEREKRVLGAMERNLRALSDDLESIERELLELEQQLQKADLPVKEGVSQQNRVDQLGTRPVLGLQLPLGVFKGPLQYMAWRDMLDQLCPAPTPLTLDPATAHRRLLLSKDLRAVSHVDVRQSQALSGPQQFDPYVCVLAAQGFTSGRHYWEVEVNNKPKWDLGVVRESIDRKGRDSPAPPTGYWIIWLRNGWEYWALTQPRIRLSPWNKPRRVGVYLDYEEGQVSFYDANTMVHLHTFTDTFSERIYPYFSPGLNDGGRNSEPLRIRSQALC
ncbi:zinc-binding protein A33-like [Narcine bancroftii]|uniref:zinc-binding protein A33-like n=1 Tax=Narcine bancroftii TaxID=1343680 RepID=UPI0038321540